MPANRFVSGLLVAVIAMAGAVGARAQTVLVVDSNLPEAVVYADQEMLGTVADGPFSLDAIPAQVRLVPPERASWSMDALRYAVDGTAVGDTLQLGLDFPYYYKIDSVPYGAMVYVRNGEQRQLLGETPLLHIEEVPLEGELVVEVPGYGRRTLTVEESRVWNRYNVTLERMPSMGEQPGHAVSWREPRKPRRWIEAVALGTALTAGALAVHYKFKADRRFEQHAENGDPRFINDIERFDRYSGIALGTMQVGIGVLAIRLVLR
ncbi:MAG: hypothetical protein RhofKO_11780 [Rhodothermales bacterium]